ncbi:MAG: o-succinylbenzoate synthase, partial [Acidobacteriota bacterium]|nr:o-succinylbenzoate synthase [Acidobacteriota bacterium]
LEGFTLPGDVSASKRYWHEDIIAPAVEITDRGTIIAPEGPGIGFEVKRDRVESIKIRAVTIRA